ncbi:MULTISPECIES: hypothetical protein [unclassified Amycolatopsis]|uniref:hypothetical protein n=1 Tax=unclassified Amycolatopsis TaxID=2618356 RepID=UPI00287538FC|nr:MULTISPECIES: hypothetical protein [unclassified Amycolatopsis]MDS0134152.1 hypothetical protein [Amycolatopsis sp. 505]MDS0145028.1 hypothetical protein [Amycolatopsis sp. CM201R]
MPTFAAEELRASGHLVAAAGLAPESRVVPAGGATSGPFTESSSGCSGRAPARSSPR